MSAPNPTLQPTSRAEPGGDRVGGLATGADDYIVKPFSVPELMARVKTALRRANPHSVGPALRAGDLELDRETAASAAPAGRCTWPRPSSAFSNT